MSDFNTTQLEENVIGAILADDANFDEIADQLRKDHFSDRYLGMLYEVISGLLMRNVKPQLSLVCQTVKQQPDGVDLKAMLARFVKNAPSSIQDHCEFIIDAFQRREAMQRLLVDAVALIKDETKPAQEQIEAAQALLEGIRGTKGRDGPQSFAEASQELIDDMERAFKGEIDLGIDTNLTFLDELMNGLMPGETTFLGGAPSIGKSSLAVQAAISIARGTQTRPPVPVGFLSNEMTNKLMIARQMTAETGVNAKGLLRGRFNQEEFERVIHAQMAMRNLPMHIEAKGCKTVDAIRVKIKRMVRLHGIRVAVLDHFHNLRMPQRDSERSYSENAHALQEIAQDLEIHLVIACQLNKPRIPLGGIRNEDEVPKPNPNDMRGSGAMFEVADHIILINRPEYYLSKFGPQNPDDTYHSACDKWRGKAQLIYAKARMGEPDITKVCGFDKTRFQFSELEYQSDFGGF